MSAKADFMTMAKERYDTLVKEEETLKVKLKELQKEIRPIRVCLTEAGIIERPTRAKRKPPAVKTTEG